MPPAAKDRDVPQLQPAAGRAIEPAPSTITAAGISGCRSRIAAHVASRAATLGALIGPPAAPGVSVSASAAAWAASVRVSPRPAMIAVRYIFWYVFTP